MRGGTGNDIEVNQRFSREVKARVDAYFDQNRLSRHANVAMIVKTLTLVSLYLGPYALIISGSLSWQWMWALCFVMAVGMAGVGFSVTHDALHGAYSASPRVNRLIGYFFEALGGNSYIWKIEHNGIHHTYTNIKDYDVDIEPSPVLRLSPHAPHRPIHQVQHVLAFLGYSIVTLRWVFLEDFKDFFRKDLGPHRNRKHPRSEWISLFFAKSVYYVVMILVPLFILDITWWQFLVGFLTVHLTASLILVVAFEMAHVVELTDHFEATKAKSLKDTWMLHQMRTTSDFARGNRLLSWYLGGLNYQIEHHLFPRICHVHYRHLSPIVEQVARKHGVPYHSYLTLWAAIRSHYRMLKRLGDPRWQPVGRALAAAGGMANAPISDAPWRA